MTQRNTMHSISFEISTKKSVHYYLMLQLRLDAKNYLFQHLSEACKFDTINQCTLHKKYHLEMLRSNFLKNLANFIINTIHVHKFNVRNIFRYFCLCDFLAMKQSFATL